ncbi:hypothetical protein V6N12_024112 [Hibiscus sabdariffa]|uniref:Aminotransferase-like plant mobile domain-containing protein n=1 Tax=Hibiscus sabdariffa TaxID=183260 RepID=A0ABR2FZK9_9ROSI
MTKKIYNFAQNLLPKKFNFHSVVVEKLNEMGFENLIKPVEVANHCYLFLSAIMQRYNREKKCFEFGEHNSIRLFITLEDALRITGLRIDCNPVIIKETSINLKHLCFKQLGNDDMLSNKGDICLSKLNDHFVKLKSDNLLENPNLIFHIRAVVFYIIVSIVAPFSSSTVPTLCLALLEDVKTIKSCACGAAMLAHLYWSLDRIKDQNSIISGISTLFRGPIIPPEFIEEVNGRPRKFPLKVEWHQKMMFILEHIPWVVSQLLYPGDPNILPDFIEEVNDCPMEFPLMVEWHKKMGMPLKDSRNAFNESTFTNYFSQLSEDNVNDILGTPTQEQDDVWDGGLQQDHIGTLPTQEQDDVGMVGCSKIMHRMNSSNTKKEDMGDEQQDHAAQEYDHAGASTQRQQKFRTYRRRKQVMGQIKSIPLFTHL